MTLHTFFLVQFSVLVCAISHRRRLSPVASSICFDSGVFGRIVSCRVAIVHGTAALKWLDARSIFMPALKTEYPNLRENLNPNFANRSDKAIEAVFERYGMDAEAAEGFFSDLGKFAQK